jgi:MYXO-CTERM domain-containing protein
VEVGARVAAHGPFSGNAVRGGALALCAAPSLLVGGHFLWTRALVSERTLLALMPLNLVPLLLSHSRPLSDFGGAGLAAAALAAALARRQRSEGHKYV